ncbi:hypothetical protein L484_001251 [Morus notabilis]|uniref:Uncharacterized protein n=1 Tax=Morus notabilis TaxID=981085 RepID=W9SFH6_9ROSA|nr:hypothetical protein L484_001251 [Morus notabilis]
MAILLLQHLSRRLLRPELIVLPSIDRAKTSLPESNEQKPHQQYENQPPNQQYWRRLWKRKTINTSSTNLEYFAFIFY